MYVIKLALYCKKIEGSYAEIQIVEILSFPPDFLKRFV